MQNASEKSKEETQALDPIVYTIVQLIEDKVGRNVYAVDVRQTSNLCDYCIIAEGSVDRHVKAIAQHLQKELQCLGHKTVKCEGLQEGQWVILDYLNVMIHLLTPAFREKYRLERLWEEGSIIDLNAEPV